MKIDESKIMFWEIKNDYVNGIPVYKMVYCWKALYEYDGYAFLVYCKKKADAVEELKKVIEKYNKIASHKDTK